MPRIWKFEPWFPYEIGMETLVRHCSFENTQEVFAAGVPAREFRKGSFPRPKLRLTLEEFDVDCFRWDGLTLVSERMRSAMALDPTEVEFLDVDASASAPHPRSKGFMVLNVPVSEEMSAPSRSSHELTKLAPDIPSIPLNVKSIAIREGFAPQHELFFDHYFLGNVFCSDSFAMRLLRAGCTGVRFFDLSQLSVGVPMRFRTLQGVEEEGKWDPIKKIEHTKLIEQIQ